MRRVLLSKRVFYFHARSLSHADKGEHLTMRLADAYRRLHPRTSDSDDSTVHSTHTNETEMSPPLGDEAHAWIQERVASNDLGLRVSAVSTSPVARRQGAWPSTSVDEQRTRSTHDRLSTLRRMRFSAQLKLSRTAGPCDELEFALLLGPSEGDVDATPRARSLGPGRPAAPIPPVAATCAVAHEDH